MIKLKRGTRKEWLLIYLQNIKQKNHVFFTS